MLLTLVAMLAVAFPGLVAGEPVAAPASIDGRRARVDSLPNLSVTTLEGSPARLRDLLGDGVTVVNLWATWCLPCRDEIPDLNELYERRAGDLSIVGIAVESGSIAQVSDWLRPYSVRYPVAVGISGQQIIDEFHAPGLPFTILVDQGGRILREMYGQQTIKRLEGALADVGASRP